MQKHLYIKATSIVLVFALQGFAAAQIPRCPPFAFASGKSEVSGGACKNNDDDQGQIEVGGVTGADDGALIVAYDATEQNSGNGCDAGGTDAGLAHIAANTDCTAANLPWFGCTGFHTGPFVDGTWTTLVGTDLDAINNPRVAILCNDSISPTYHHGALAFGTGSAFGTAPSWNAHMYIAYIVFEGIKCADLEVVNSAVVGASLSETITTNSITPSKRGVMDLIITLLATNSGDTTGMNKAQGTWTPGNLASPPWNLIQADHDHADTLDDGDYQFNYQNAPNGGYATSYSASLNYATYAGQIKDGAGIIVELNGCLAYGRGAGIF